MKRTICALSAEPFTQPDAIPIFGLLLMPLEHCQEQAPRRGAMRGVVGGAEERDRGMEGFQEGYINEADPSVLRFLIASRSPPPPAPLQRPHPLLPPGGRLGTFCSIIQDGLPESEGL